MFPNMTEAFDAHTDRIESERRRQIAGVAAGSVADYRLRTVLDELTRRAEVAEQMTGFAGAGAMYAAEANAYRQAITLILGGAA